MLALASCLGVFPALTEPMTVVKSIWSPSMVMFPYFVALALMDHPPKQVMYSCA